MALQSFATVGAAGIDCVAEGAAVIGWVIDCAIAWPDTRRPAASDAAPSTKLL